MSRYYSGVGSRGTPQHVCEAMADIASELERRNYILRSGHAPGADAAFESGIRDPRNAEIYLPWKGFGGSNSELYDVCEDAKELARLIHPSPQSLKLGPLKLHARNCYQVLGRDLATPSAFLLCWTEGGKKVGGTRTAIVLAEANSIPILNFGTMDSYKRCMNAFDLFFAIHGDF